MPHRSSTGKIVGVIQARMGSARLPGKALLPIAGRTALAYLIMRVRRAASLHQLVVATSRRSENDAIAAECARLGLACFRGSEEDVYKRLMMAGQAYGADVVVRLTGDDVLMDPEIIDYMVAQFHSGTYACATNLTSRSFPNGFVVSVLSIDALRRAETMALSRFEREHVVVAFLKRRQCFAVLDVAAPPQWRDYNVGFALDTAPDYARLCEVVQLLHAHDTRFGLAELLRHVAMQPLLYERSRLQGHYWDHQTCSAR